MSLTPASLFFTRLTKVSTSPPSALICSSISRTDWFAPPWSGPKRALIPAETEANRLACEEPTSRTVEVEQFCSWSAWRTRSCSRASTMSGSRSYGSAGNPNVIRRKFSVSESELSG